MTLRDMTPEELELFEEQIAPKPDDIPDRRPHQPEQGKPIEADRDKDGIPDKSGLKRRVPS